MSSSHGAVAPDDQPSNARDSAGHELDKTELRYQLIETREEITRIDSKASILLAGAGIAVGAILAGLIAGDVQLFEIPGVAAIIAGLASAAALTGLGFVAAALYPRCGSPEPDRARYFAEAAAYPTLKALSVALLEDARVGDRLIHQLFGLSKSVAKKYSMLRCGMRLLSAAVVLSVVAALLNGVLS